MALAASMSGYYAGPTATTLGNSLSLGAGLRQVSEKASRAHGCWLRLIPHRCSAGYLLFSVTE